MRAQTQLESLSRPTRHVEWPKRGGRPAYLSEVFGESVFSLKTLQTTLPKPVYARFIQQISGRQSIDRSVADSVAHAVRVWAMDRYMIYC
jgi:glutamine synthetase